MKVGSLGATQHELHRPMLLGRAETLDPTYSRLIGVSRQLRRRIKSFVTLAKKDYPHCQVTAEIEKAMAHSGRNKYQISGFYSALFIAHNEIRTTGNEYI